VALCLPISRAKLLVKSLLPHILSTFPLYILASLLAFTFLSSMLLGLAIGFKTCSGMRVSH
jgi:hypothetical protein